MSPTTAAEPSADRRIAPRVQPAFDTVFRFAASPEADPIIGLVWNISETGVSMLLTEPLPPDALVNGELTGERGGPGLPVTVQVVHVVPMPSGDYFLGGRFDRPLSPDELQAFTLSPGRRSRPPADPS